MTQLRLFAISLLFACGAATIAADDNAVKKPTAETRTIRGWTLHINKNLIDDQPKATARALELLDKQLEEIERVVPKTSVVKLKKVPLYFNPQYPGQKPIAEFHPDAKWLRENGRDPAMAKCVEFSNIPNFEKESNRMPNVTLHELAHAFHNRVLEDGFENEEIQLAFERAKQSGGYEKVERHHGNGKPNSKERAYAMTNPMEYFAECSEAYFTGNDFFPFNRDELKQHDPGMFAVLEKLWNVR